MSNKTQLSKENTTKERKNKKKLLALLLALAIVVVSATVGLGYTFSRYADTLNDDYHYIEAKDFFFTADYLSESTPVYTIYDFEGTRTVTFNVYNYADDLSITADDIEFSATTSGGTITSGTQTLARGTKSSKAITLTVTTAGEYTVQVSSTSPYTKTISAKFKFVDYSAPRIDYTITNQNDYVVLNVGIGAHRDATCNVVFAWDSSKFILDTTNDLFTTVATASGYKSSVVSGMATGGSYQVILYKKTLGSAAPTKASTAAGTANTNMVYVGVQS